MDDYEEQMELMDDDDDRFLHFVCDNLTADCAEKLRQSNRVRKTILKRNWRESGINRALSYRNDPSQLN
eukprot:3940137-Rhodomonas_salina.1